MFETATHYSSQVELTALPWSRKELWTDSSAASKGSVHRRPVLLTLRSSVELTQREGASVKGDRPGRIQLQDITLPLDTSQTERWNFWRSLREFNLPMRHLLLSDILIRFCERVPYAWVVIFAMDYIGISAQQVGVLTAIEMLAATLCIIPASHYADRYRREPFVIVTFIMFTLFPISLLMSRSFSALVIAFTIRGLKEFGDTSRKALIIGYSDSGRRGQMIGSYYLVRDLVVSTGAILGAYLWKLGPALNFLGAAALGMAGTIFYIRTTRRAGNQPE